MISDPLLHGSSQVSTRHTEGESGWALRGSSSRTQRVETGSGAEAGVWQWTSSLYGPAPAGLKAWKTGECCQVTTRRLTCWDLHISKCWGFFFFFTMWCMCIHVHVSMHVHVKVRGHPDVQVACVPCCLGTSLLHTQLASQIHYCMAFPRSVQGTQTEWRQGLGQSDSSHCTSHCVPYPPGCWGAIQSGWGHLLSSRSHALPCRVSEVTAAQPPSL